MDGRERNIAAYERERREVENHLGTYARTTLPATYTS